MLERVKREEAEENRLKSEKASEARLVAEVICQFFKFPFTFKLNKEAIGLLRLKLKEEKQAQAEIEQLYRCVLWKGFFYKFKITVNQIDAGFVRIPF